MAEKNDNNNLVDLVEKAKQKQKKQGRSSTGENPTSLTSAQKQALFADWLNGKLDPWLIENEIDLKAPTTSFAFVKSVDKVKQLYEITEQKELKTCTLETVEEVIGATVHNHYRLEFDMTDRQIDGCARYWAKITPAIPCPPLYGFAGEDSLCVRRLPFKLETGPKPLFDEMFSRIDNGLALKIFVGSLFFPKSNKQQYIWMHGAGDDGKGVFINVLSDILGHTFSSQSEPTANDRFWTYGIKDARLVVFPDTNNIDFVTSGLCKSIVGDDPVRLERKGGAVFSARLMAKLMFVSNSKPDISSAIADKRRIIYCEWKPFDGKKDTNIKDQLLKEAPYFITECIELYKKHCPNDELIPHSKERIDKIVEENESHFQMILDKYCNVGPQFRTIRWQMWELITTHFKKRKDQFAFKKFLETKGIVIKYEKRKNMNHVDYFYTNVAILLAPRDKYQDSE